MIKVKEDDMGKVCSTSGEKRNAYMLLVREPEGKRALGRPRCRLEDNIKMDLKKIGWGGMDWIGLAVDREFKGFCASGMGLLVSIKA
jgi:hypothetical protein